MKTTSRIPKLAWAVVLALVLALSLSACKGKEQPPAPAASTEPSALQPGSNDPTSPAETVPESSELPAGSFDLPDPSVGLESLNSYHQEFSLDVQGETASGGYVSHQSVLRDVSGANEAVLITDAVEGSAPVYLFSAVLDGFRYTQDAEADPCRAAPSDSSNGTGLNPALRIPPVRDAVAGEQEVIDGIPALHYTFDERSVLGESGVDGEARGEVWLAVDRPLVLKYNLTLDLSLPEFTGTRTWSYQLTEVDQEVAVTLPDACQPVLAGFPVLPDAENLEHRPGFLRYSANASRRDAVSFYSDRLPYLGWQALPGSSLDGADFTSDVTVISYAQARGEAGRLLVIRLTESDGMLQVLAQTANTKYPIRIETGSAPIVPPEDIDAEETEEPGGTPLPVPELPSELPLYPGATVLTQDQSYQFLQTADPVEDVAGFYRAELENAGWTLDQLTELEGMVSQEWSSEDRALNIMIISQGGVTQIMVSANR